MILFSIWNIDAQRGGGGNNGGISSNFECPNERSGQYKDHSQCDKYYECDDGYATERLCPDGLVFDETIRLKNKCDQPFNVDCGNRTELRK